MQILINPNFLFSVKNYNIEAINIHKEKGKLIVDYHPYSEFVHGITNDEIKKIAKQLDEDAVEKLIYQAELLNEQIQKGSNFIQTELLKHLQLHFRKLAQRGSFTIYINQSNSAKASVNKSYQLQAYMPTPRFIVLKNEGVYTIAIDFQLHKEWINDKEILRNRFLLMYKNELFILNHSDAQLLDWVQKNVATKSITSFAELEEKYIPTIEKVHKVDKTQVVEKTCIDVTPQFKIYIRESLGAYIFIEPKVFYDDIELPIIIKETNNNTTDIINKGKLFSIRRNVSEEVNFYKIVQAKHPNFEKQFNTYFQINFGEAGKKQWFYKFFSFCLSNNIELVGMDLMLHFRYAADKAKTVCNILEVQETKVQFEIEISFGKEKVPLSIIQKTIRNQQHSFPLKDNSIAVLDDEWMQQYATIMKHGLVEDTKLTVSKSFVVAMQLSVDDAFWNQEILTVTEKHWKEEWLQWQDIHAAGLVKATTNATLRPYQQKGLDWLYLLQKIGAGAMLADDMGLGKTLQTIVYLQHNITTHKASTHLIVAPASLIYNWQNEIEKFAPNLTVSVFYGSNRNWESCTAAKTNIIITTYAVCRIDIEKIATHYFDTIVLDESHNIKNANALATQAIFNLNGAFKIALSGTPVMNNTFDLYSQFQFILPGLFYSKSFFLNEYAKPIDEYKDEAQLQKLQKLTAPFILRRTKEQVAKELPPKVETILWCSMKEDQQQLYDEVKDASWQALQEIINKEGASKSRLQIQNTLLRLRQICDSPLLLPDELNENNLVTSSIKLELLVDEIVHNTSNSKVVVFSQFTTMMDLIIERLDAAQISNYRLDGTTTAAKRQELVDNFQEPNNTTKVFVISLKAGGVGLTLTQASYVYVVDPWWNKAIENQAIDRCYRIGQQKTVFAYKMICKNSIEEKILKLQERKSFLSESLIQIEEDFVKNLSEEDLNFIFT